MFSKTLEFPSPHRMQMTEKANSILGITAYWSKQTISVCFFLKALLYVENRKQLIFLVVHYFNHFLHLLERGLHRTSRTTPPKIPIYPGSLTNHRSCMRASIIPMARVTVYSCFWTSQSNSGDWGQHSSPLTSNPNLEMWQRRQRGPALSRSSKFLPFYNSENAPFELGGRQIIYRFSGGIPAPKLLFALAAMTEGKEFEQCLCIIDSFPLSSCPPQREEILLNNIIYWWFYDSWHFQTIYTIWSKIPAVTVLLKLFSMDQNPPQCREKHITSLFQLSNSELSID